MEVLQVRKSCGVGSNPTLPTMQKILNWLFPYLIEYIPYKEIGWKELGEIFYRWQLIKTPWFNIYLHRLYAPIWHDKCHDHPWHFWAIILAGGYWEDSGKGPVWRSPGEILYRQANWKHNVITKNVNWSIIVTSNKVRPWGFLDCGNVH